MAAARTCGFLRRSLIVWLEILIKYFPGASVPSSDGKNFAINGIRNGMKTTSIKHTIQLFAMCNEFNGSLYQIQCTCTVLIKLFIYFTQWAATASIKHSTKGVNWSWTIGQWRLILPLKIKGICSIYQSDRSHGVWDLKQCPNCDTTDKF